MPQSFLALTPADLDNIERANAHHAFCSNLIFASKRAKDQVNWLIGQLRSESCSVATAEFCKRIENEFYAMFGRDNFFDGGTL